MSSEVLVVDANVALRWFLPEPQRAAALAVLERDAWLIAPELLLVEVGNGLRKKVLSGQADTARAFDCMATLRQVLDEVYPAARLLPRALELSIELRHPIYDCLYLALAEAKGVDLVTADGAFADVLEGHPLRARVRVLSV